MDFRDFNDMLNEDKESIEKARNWKKFDPFFVDSTGPQQAKKGIKVYKEAALDPTSGKIFKINGDEISYSYNQGNKSILSTKEGLSPEEKLDIIMKNSNQYKKYLKLGNQSPEDFGLSREVMNKVKAHVKDRVDRGYDWLHIPYVHGDKEIKSKYLLAFAIDQLKLNKKNELESFMKN